MPTKCSRNIFVRGVLIAGLMVSVGAPAHARPQSAQQQREREQEAERERRQQEAQQQREQQREEQRQREAEERQQQARQEREQERQREAEARQQQAQQERQQQMQQQQEEQRQQQMQQQREQQMEQQRERQAEQQRQQQAEQQRQQEAARESQQHQARARSGEQVRPAESNGQQSAPPRSNSTSRNTGNSSPGASRETSSGGVTTFTPHAGNTPARASTNVGTNARQGQTTGDGVTTYNVMHNSGSGNHPPTPGAAPPNAAINVRPVIAPESAAVLNVVATGPNSAAASANAQLNYAQQQMVQSQAFQNMIAAQVARSQALYDFRDQVATLIMQNTSDPAVANAMSQLIGQSDPIQDALNQQLQGLADVSAAQAQARMAVAQANLVSVQQQQAAQQSGSGQQSGVQGQSSVDEGASQQGGAQQNDIQQQQAGQSGSAQQGVSPAGNSVMNSSSGTATANLSPSNSSNTSNTNAGGAPQYVTPTLNNCVGQFYDPTVYNWLALQNNCQQKITVAFVSRNSGSLVWGSMDLQPGAKGNTGESKQEIDSQGGILWYVCPYGYVPLDANGNGITTQAVSQYACKLQ